MGDFDNPQHTKPYGPCKYCHANVCVYGSGCEQTCNNACCDGGLPPPEECPLPDYPTDRCCPLAVVELPSSVPGWIDTLLNALLTATVRLKGDELPHAHIKRLTQRYFGTPAEDFDDGVMKKLMPPNYLFIQEEAERERVYNEWGRWEIEVEGMEEETGRIVGADEHLYEFDYATNFLSDALTKIPGQENSQASLTKEEGDLCHPVLISLGDVLSKSPGRGEGVVLAEEEGDLCHEILPGPKHSACVVKKEVGISVSQALEDILGGRIKIYPRFSFLRNIFGQTVESTFAIFDLPGETHEEFDGETEGDFEIRISLNLPLVPDWGWGVDVDEEAKVWNTGTVAYGDFTIQEKLSLPWAYVPPPTEEEPEPYEPPSEPVDYELTPEEIQRARELGLDLELVARASSISAWAARRGWSIDRGILIALTSGESANCTNCGRSDAETAYRNRGWPSQITILKKALEHWEEYDIRVANSRAAYYVNESYTAALGSSAGALGCSQFLIGTAWPHRHKVSDPSFDLWNKTTAMQTMASELHRLGWRENASLATKIGVLLGWNRHYSWVSRIVRTAQYILAYLDAAGI